jgi:hypothetical protein
LISKTTIVTIVVTTIGPANIATSVSICSARRLEAGRSQPFAHLRSGQGLSGLADGGLPNRARWKQFSLLMQAVRLVCKALLKRLRQFEMGLLLHRVAPFLGGRRERKRAFSSPIDTVGRAVMPPI